MHICVIYYRHTHTHIFLLPRKQYYYENVKFSRVKHKGKEKKGILQRFSLKRCIWLILFSQ